ncbi:strictosidine synthase [Mesorhizobium sp. YR577]|uniref:strictosidine synthase n=1 Tax=Mesorhizobium sp. YR577 TaxID=1884373 RepID=UPI0008EDD53E|nr:strictosidine synthase [Mesorhizobium sp. YR577]SFU19580.1 Strictosidine synthase [Mesorhizobium sp. YR577]
MANALRDWVDRFLGRGDAAVTVPPLDGALKPNNLLEEAPAGPSIAGADNIITTSSGLFVSSGNELLRLAGEGQADPISVYTTSGRISAVAVSTDGTLAVASAPKSLAFVDPLGRPLPNLAAGTQDWNGVTAMAFASSRDLILTIGSAANTLDEWQRDLLDGGRSGSVWKLDTKTGKATRLVDYLAYPNGVAIERDGNIIVSEAWQKQLIRLSPSGKLLGEVMEDLPGYPARISVSSRGGYWLSVFAPRNQLIEFVLREPDYRKAMMAQVDKAFWVAPALSSGRSFREPMQGGALKQMGILKPWAPTRSYGLVVELTPDFVPVRSLHSRAGGKRHGITSAIEAGGKLWATAKGGDEVVAVDLGMRGN